MGIAEYLEGDFAPVIIERGAGYFKEGRVTRVGLDEVTLRCDVRGSRNRRYRAVLEWDADEVQIAASCDCPFSQRGLLCKHVWAVVLEANSVGWPLLPPRGMALPLEIYPADEASIFEDEEEAPFEALLTSDFPQLARGHSARSERWRTQIRHVLESRAEESAARRAEPGRRAWFGLDLQRCAERDALLIAFFHQRRLKSGEWGRIGNPGCSSDEIALYEDPEDRALLRQLLAAETPATSYSGFRFAPDQQLLATVPPGLYETLLPRVLSTGRVLQQNASSRLDPEAPAFRFDPRGPWEFEVEFGTDDAGQGWKIERRLRAGHEVRALADADLLLGNGLAVFGREVGLLRVAEDMRGWFGLVGTEDIRIPAEDRVAFNQLWWSEGEPPSVELPDSLELPVDRLPVRGYFTVVQTRQAELRRSYAKVGAIYGEIMADPDAFDEGVVDPERERVLLRDREAEAKLLSDLADVGVRRSAGYYFEPAPYSFPTERFSKVVHRLLERGWQVEAGGHEMRQPGKLSVELTTGVDWFDLFGEVDFGGRSVELPALLEAARTDQGFVTLDDGSRGLISREWVRDNVPWAAMAERHEGRLRFRPSQALMIDMMLAAKDADYRIDPRGTQWRQQLLAIDELESLDPPESFQGVLREYQREGLGWLEFLHGIGLGGCLADDMGLGKTVQVLAMLERSRQRRGADGSLSLVVVPRSLVFNWLSEAARFAPSLRTLDYGGTDREARREQFSEVDLVVTTYGMVRQDITHLAKTHFEYVVLDEAQAIKNPRAQVAKACRLLDAEHRLAVTGTPVENRLTDLWSIFEFLNPGMLGQSKNFASLARRASNDESAGELLEAIGRGLRPFILRRTKEQAAPELPSKTEQTLLCELSPKHRHHYDELRDYYRQSLMERVDEVGLNRSKVHVLEALLRLRQAACHPGLVNEDWAAESSAKMERLTEQVKALSEDGHKVLVFSQFTKLLALVRTRFEQEEIGYEYLDGRTRNREQRVQQFRTDPAISAFLISLKAGGHGLNLVEASYVFILDPWWNPAVEAQAVDRTHRIGQSRPVFAYRLIATDTVEEKVVELQQKKRELVGALISENRNVLSELTEDDLSLLLS